MVALGEGGQVCGPFVVGEAPAKSRGLQVKMPVPKPVGKVPIGPLVSFFDGEKGGGRRVGVGEGLVFEAGWMEEGKGRLLG